MSAIPASVTDRNGAEHAFTYRAEPQSVRLIREMADVVIRSWALERLVPDVKLILSELATNAIAETPGKDLVLLMKHEGPSISMGIWDSSTRMPDERRCALAAESGRGLTIVAKTADAHGSHLARDRNGRIGKIIWARIVL